MAGRYIADWSAANVRNENPGQNVVVILDTANCTGDIVAERLPTAANQKPLGVVQNTVRLNPDGSVAINQYLTLRSEGTADIKVSAAVAAGALVSVSGTDGRVATATQTAGASQPAVWVVGEALTAASNANDTVSVLLSPGGQLY